MIGESWTSVQLFLVSALRYSWHIRGVFVGYSWGIHMYRVCVGYVSGMYRVRVKGFGARSGRGRARIYYGVGWARKLAV